MTNSDVSNDSDDELDINFDIITNEVFINIIYYLIYFNPINISY
jgi:hypothetical protein